MLYYMLYLCNQREMEKDVQDRTKILYQGGATSQFHSFLVSSLGEAVDLHTD